MAALGLQRVPRWFRIPFDALTYISVIIPEIVIALATLVFFAVTIGRDGIVTEATGVEIGFGYHTIVSAAALFNMSLVLLLVRARLSGMDRTMVEASYDLFATPWRTFRQITFPQLLPAIVAGFLLSFTFGFDDYVITSFVNGRGSSTLPLFVFGQIRRGVTPATNAVAAMMLLLTLALLLGGQSLLNRQARRNGRVAARSVASPGSSRRTREARPGRASVRGGELRLREAGVGGELGGLVGALPGQVEVRRGRSGRTPRSGGRSAGAGRGRR